MAEFRVQAEKLSDCAQRLRQLSGNVSSAQQYADAYLPVVHNTGGLNAVFLSVARQADDVTARVRSLLRSIDDFLTASAAELDGAAHLYQVTDRQAAAKLDRTYPEAERPATDKLFPRARRPFTDTVPQKSDTEPPPPYDGGVILAPGPGPIGEPAPVEVI